MERFEKRRKIISKEEVVLSQENRRPRRPRPRPGPPIKRVGDFERTGGETLLLLFFITQKGAR